MTRMRWSAALVAVLLASPVAPQVGYVPTAHGSPSGEPPLVAVSTLEYGSIGEVDLEIFSPWPRALAKGYAPILVRIVNTGEKAHDLSIDINRKGSDWETDYETHGAAHVEPGESRLVELLAPAFEVREASYNMSRYVLVTVRSSRTSDILHVGFQTDQVTAKPWPMVLTRAHGEGGAVDIYELASKLEPTLSPGRPQLGLATGDELPRRVEAYTSLVAVLVDAQSVPTEAELEPAFAWTRMGGTLAFVGPGAREAAHSLPSVRSWMEDRFRRDGPEDYVQPSPGDGPVGWQMGLGSVLVLPSPDLVDPLDRAFLKETIDEYPSSEPTLERSRWFVPQIPDLGELPFRTFAFLMVLFAVLVGPVNFIVLKRMNRNALLLVTIPGMAGVVALGFLAYGTLYQGIDVKRAEHSLSLLDQRSHRASTISARQVFAGLSPGGGLRPAPGTVVLPMQDSRDRPGRFVMNLGGEVSLTADYLPARTAADQVVLSDRAARLRVDVRREGTGWVAENGLTEEIETLAWRAPDGGWFGWQDGMEPGETVQLRPISDAIWRKVLGSARNRSLSRGEDLTRPGSYLAVMERNPFTDDCGIGSVEYDGWHLVAGVVEIAEEPR